MNNVIEINRSLIKKDNPFTSTERSQSSEQFDMVNKPPHYTQGRMEVIDMMLKVFGKEAVINYCEINAFKYRMRAGHKNDITEDIKKAMWYESKAKELFNENAGNDD